MSDDFQELIREAGLRATQPRISLLEHMQDLACPLSLDGLAESKNADLGDRATIFRNLVALSDAGLVQQVQSLGKRQLYEVQSREHAHVTCVECGTTECISAPLELPKSVKVKNWKKIHSSITYWGTCVSCAD